ncbi:hypothetical protein [Fundidesulfovibrio magnetotacticus]|uniref:hypothetical protein n=1 Tax=Fundidesulfovibrio magnetotacticus TaxID=2730080 RepID=UPI00156540F8|nr:hypothetical protein [Fundidesulfovibrio magnetotacticus]
MIEDKVAFQYVEGVEVDGADVCTFKAQKDKEGKLAAYQASAGAFLIDHPLYEAGETMSYPLHYDPEEGAYYFLLGNGKVTGRKKKSKVSNEVEEVPGASAASPESDNERAEDVGA